MECKSELEHFLDCFEYLDFNPMPKQEMLEKEEDFDGSERGEILIKSSVEKTALNRTCRRRRRIEAKKTKLRVCYIRDRLV